MGFELLRKLFKAGFGRNWAARAGDDGFFRFVIIAVGGFRFFGVRRCAGTGFVERAQTALQVGEFVGCGVDSRMLLQRRKELGVDFYVIGKRRSRVKARDKCVPSRRSPSLSENRTDFWLLEA